MSNKEKKEAKIPRIGVHVSGFGPLPNAVKKAMQFEIPVFQFFTGNARAWESKPIDPTQADEFKRLIKETKILPVAHMPYIPNLASPEPETYDKSCKALVAEMERCALLDVPYLVTHLGSHKGTGEEGGRARIVKAVKKGISTKSSGDVKLLLENTAGTKNSLGTTFADLAAILEAVDSDRVGICFDTAHGLAAGYDIRSVAGVDLLVEDMKKHVAVEKLKVIHLNDSKVKFAGKADRHEHIGKGHLGKEGIRAILTNKTLRKLPFVLETPVEEEGDDLKNIKRARTLAVE